MTGLALLGMALAIVAEGSLAFLGLSVAGVHAHVGQDDRRRLVRHVAARRAALGVRADHRDVPRPSSRLNFIGDRLRAHLEVRQSAL